MELVEKKREDSVDNPVSAGGGGSEKKHGVTFDDLEAGRKESQIHSAHDIDWTSVPVAGSTLEVMNAIYLRHRVLYKCIWIVTLFAQFGAAAIVNVAVALDEDDAHASYIAWCLVPSNTYTKVVLLGVNKFVALSLTAICCLTEIGVLIDIFSEGLFIHKTWAGRCLLGMHSFSHFCTIIGVYVATARLECWATSTTDCYLNCVALLFIFEIKSQIAQAMKMRVVRGHLMESNLTALTDGIEQATGVGAIAVNVIDKAGSTVKRIVNNAKQRGDNLARRATWAFEGGTNEEQESWFIRTILFTILAVLSMYSSFNTCLETIRDCDRFSN
jgi:hypothetical protein